MHWTDGNTPDALDHLWTDGNTPDALDHLWTDGNTPDALDHLWTDGNMPDALDHLWTDGNTPDALDHLWTDGNMPDALDHLWTDGNMPDALHHLWYVHQILPLNLLNHISLLSQIHIKSLLILCSYPAMLVTVTHLCHSTSSMNCTKHLVKVGVMQIRHIYIYSDKMW